MKDAELRARARRLYAANVLPAVLLAWCYNVFEPLPSLVVRMTGLGDGWIGSLLLIAVSLAAAPLLFGALSGLLQLSDTGEARLACLTDWYRDGRWKNAVTLAALQQAITLLDAASLQLIGTGLGGGALGAVSVLVLQIGWIWLTLRLAMANLLLLTGAAPTAMDALRGSFARMKGQVSGYIEMWIMANLIPLGISLLLGGLTTLHPELAAVVDGVNGAVKFLFAPYIVLSMTAWLAQRMRDPQV